MGSGGGGYNAVPICWRRGKDKRADAPSSGQLGWSGQNLQQIDNFTSGAPCSRAIAVQMHPRARGSSSS